MQFHLCLMCVCLSPALSTLQPRAFQHHLSMSLSTYDISSSVTFNATYLLLCHRQLSIPCCMNRVNCSSPHRTTTTLCVLYGEPCTTCCVAILNMPVHVHVHCRFVGHAVLHFFLRTIISYKTHDCVHLLHTACGSSTTTSGITPTHSNCLALQWLITTPMLMTSLSVY